MNCLLKAVTVVLRGILSYSSRVKNHLDLVLYKLNPSLMQVAAQQEQQDWPSNAIEGSSLGYIYVPVLPFVLVSCLKVKLTESFSTKKKSSLSHMDYLPFFHMDHEPHVHSCSPNFGWNPLGSYKFNNNVPKVASPFAFVGPNHYIPKKDDFPRICFPWDFHGSWFCLQKIPKIISSMLAKFQKFENNYILSKFQTFCIV